MEKFAARDFLDVFTIISNLASQLDSLPINGDSSIPEEQKKAILPVLDKARTLSNELGLDVSVRLINEIDRSLQVDCTVVILKRALLGLRSRVLDEIEISPLVLRIRREKVRYFDGADPFDAHVASQFPMASYDIEEASKCFALARYAGCVMHLQKVVEAGLRAFANWAQLSGILEELKQRNPNWGKILIPLRQEVRRRNDADSWSSTADKEFCENVRPFIEAVKTAWRNPSMHVGSQYGEEEAEDIYFTVRGFMRFLATHLDEDGNFYSDTRQDSKVGAI